ncbi:MAG: type II toxin-antitoxin system PemK/MazF family toxin [Rhizobiales bacterium]|nr:type II toxin-antitoxin system PemK/MazF family toxin [Hyphomicrobiales bacterium]
MRRGEVWLAALDPRVGSENQEGKPCLIVSPDRMIEGLSTIIVAPFSGGSRATSFRPSVRLGDADRIISLEQIRAVDKSRLLRRLGRLDDKAVTQSLATLRWMFAE